MTTTRKPDESAMGNGATAPDTVAAGSAGRVPGKHRSWETTEGIIRAPNRSMMWAMGLTDKDINAPFVGVASTHNEVTPCNSGIAPLVEEVQARRLCGEGYALRLRDNNRFRRYLDGYRRHEGFPCFARSHRRLDRDGVFCRAIRRPRCCSRLRQVIARRHDGDGAAQLAVDLHLRRIDTSGQLARAGHPDPDGV